MTLGKTCRLSAALVACFFTLATGHLARAQESALVFRWTTKDRHVFPAKFLRLQSSSLVVERDGFEFKVPISVLSPASLQFAHCLEDSRGPSAIRATGAASPDPVASFTYGPSILAFCQDSVGKRIGNGQCADLAAQALKNIGAPLRAGADWPGEGDYVWGEPVAWVRAGFLGLKGDQELAHVEAGDIVQFHNTRFTGFDHSDAGIYRLEARHHTAVVESVDVARKSITVLHQNWNNQEIVRRETLFLRGMTRGWLRFYHPTPATG